MKTFFAIGMVLLSPLVVLADASSPSGIIHPLEAGTRLSTDHPIDRFVAADLTRRGIQPARLCSDAVFVRRVFLDVIGTLPTEQEVRDFLADNAADKRSRLIDDLLQRDEFADYWSMKWGDVLRIKAEFPINLWPNGVQAYHRWVHTCLRDNVPYDQFAREMLTASGSNFRVPQVNFYRAVQGNDPESIANAVVLTFMGSRYEDWPKDQQQGMAAFFSKIGFKQTSEWKEEIIFFDAFGAANPTAKTSAGPMVFPDGTVAKVASNQDPRVVFADWLIQAENPWFARNIVNRIWCWLLGRGIVHEPDDIRLDNPPSNPQLLAWLEKQLVEADYDLRQIYRLILNSNTYQLSSIPHSDHPDAAACFAYYSLRRLEAEVLIDALCQITGTKEEYSSPIPEPFAFIPDTHRSIVLADGSTTSSFLEMFGRPPRDTGLESERNNRPTAAQRLHLLNSSHIRQKLENSEPLRAIARAEPEIVARRLYLTILSRPPTDRELQVLRQYAQSGVVSGREVLVDIAWALINSSEFLYRH